ncbi:CPBP family intramembrane glutamic endopeptidase [Mesonia sp. K7]|uniref:CPBP family intramembrane glutamic endopeptidase n=1 Tax=Mesonia sp. K7 TaxID=2218606 RepID=UPI000DA94C5C|nr:CPBP family intramembrane glutamic endopeptidase [Mesonia sp. K7]PZD77252.1 CPBP family intramembrane metalloprotease domain-containing protein [Mesonia sp. K7]
MFIQQAFRGETGFWRYLIGSLIIAGCSVMGQMILYVLVTVELEGNIYAINEETLMSTLDSNLTLGVLLFSFVLGFLGLLFSIKFLHQISLKAITTTRSKFDFKRFFFGFGLIAFAVIVSTVVDYQSNPEDYVWNFKAERFLILAVIAILLVPVQTSLEEFIFRGYLMQGFGVLAKNKGFALMMTSLIFGLLHIANPEVGKLGYIIMFYYIGTGLFFGIMTLMDEGLELALGFHAGNNLIGALLVTADWTVFKTDSILKDISEPTAGFDIFLPLLIFYPLCLLIMAKVYKWNNWKEKLLGKVEKPNEALLEN